VKRLAILCLLSLSAGALSCAVHDETTHVYVRDPRQVWVEAWTSEGERVLLPAGQGLRGVSVHADVPDPDEDSSHPRSSAAMPAMASVFREPQGGITIDHPSCAPWPTNPLSSRGELTVVKPHGRRAFTSDGRNLRVPFECDDGKVTVLDLAFVTPLGNVKEVDVVEDAPAPPVARGSTDPALQPHPWER
jgi:hypothetical protein